MNTQDAISIAEEHGTEVLTKQPREDCQFCLDSTTTMTANAEPICKSCLITTAEEREEG